MRPAKRDLKGEKHWRINPEIAGCGYFCDLAPHMIDILQFFLGSIVQADGSTSNKGKLYNAEDVVNANFQFKNGINANANAKWDFSAVDDLDRTEIIGSEGSIVYSTFGETPIEIIINKK